MKISNSQKALYFGKYSSHHMFKTPKRVLQMLSYYKFVSNFIPPNQNILDVGCNEGFGTSLLAKQARSVVGVDFDEEAIGAAKQLWTSPNLEFIHKDFRELEVNTFDVVTLFDVAEHIFPENFPRFMESLLKVLAPKGILAIGMPSLEQQQYASEVVKKGHVNCMTGQKLQDLLDHYFHHAFVFCGNDEVVHTGFWPMANYLLGIGCIKK